MKYDLFFSAAVFLTAAASAFCGEPGGDNLLQNGGFEKNDTAPVGWFRENNGVEGETAIVRENPFEGKNALKLVHRSEDHNWLRVSRTGKIKPQTRYKFTIAVKSNAPYWVEFYQFDIKGKRLKALTLAKGNTTTDQWLPAEQAFITEKEARTMKLSLISPGKGIVFYDAADLREVHDKIREVTTSVIPDSPFRLDGCLDEPFWKEIPFMENFSLLGARKDFVVPTRAKICADSGGFRIGFYCGEPLVSRMLANAEEDSIAVYHDDCVEVFMDLRNKGEGYFHFIGNSAGRKGGEQYPGARLVCDWFDYGSGAAPVNTGWSYAAHKGKDYWSAEFYIPYKTLGYSPQKQDQGRINFARERKAAGKEEYGSWAISPVVNFHNSQSFGILKYADSIGNFSPAAAIPDSAVTKNNTSPVEYPDYRKYLYPVPRKMSFEKGYFSLENASISGIPKQGFLRNRLTLLNKILQNRFGKVPLKESPDGAIQIRILPGFTPSADSGFRDARPEKSMPSLREQAYRLTATPGKIEIQAASETGAAYAMNTLIKLLLMEEKPQIPCVEITDYPAFQIRGLQLCAPYRPCPWKPLVEMASLMNYNRLWLKLEHRIQNPETPSLGGGKDTMTWQEMHRVVGEMRENGFDVCPEHTAYSHIEFLTKIPGNEFLGDGGANAKNLNVRNPRAIESMKQIYDNIFRVFAGAPVKAFNITHDELSHGLIGVSPETKNLKPGILFQENLIFWNRYLKEKGVEKVYLWGDMLKARGAGANGGAPFNTYRAREAIPRDMVVLDWIYSAIPAYDGLAEFRKDGFQTAPATWFTPQNIQDFFSAAAKLGLYETLGTTWMQLPWIFRSPVLRGGYILNAAVAWNPVFKLKDWNVTPADYFSLLERYEKPVENGTRRVLPMKPDSQEEFPCVKNCSAFAGTDRIHWNGFDFPVSSRHYLKLNKKTSPDAAIAVGSRADSLVLLNATSDFNKEGGIQCLDKGFDLALMKIHYQDGSHAEIPLRTQTHSDSWNSPVLPVSSFTAFRAHTDDGKYFRLLATPLRNPHPEKIISSVSFHSRTERCDWDLFGIGIEY